eukprot:TRINITY_DN16145_c0_g1_i3.p2 TRINITY_DN16145_c0_g1~~TRINITY_DN16145_c0_g1_i3.p2  ORF type:complete len:197 (-),score=27.84 TRINITY_DN16145_c0_g1_i3:137-727(-)
MDTADSYVRLQLITLGSHMVGKTSILTRFKEEKFSLATYTTIGVDFVGKNMVIDSTNVKLKIWDTAGQDRYQTIPCSFYKQCQGIMFVFDVGSRQSFTDINRWVEKAEQHASCNAMRYLIANKVDIDKREVTQEEGMALAVKYDMKYFEVSAKTGFNINEAIEYIVDDVFHNRQCDSPRKSQAIRSKMAGKQFKCC